MFRDYWHRTYQALTRSRKRGASKIAGTSRPAGARLGIEGLEDRNLLSTLSLGLYTAGALVYTPDTSVTNTLSISDNPATHRYTIVDTNENITLFYGPFINPTGGFTHTVSFGDGNITSIAVNTGNQNFTVNIEQSLSGAPVTVNLGNGTDAVNVSPAAHNLDNIQGAINVHPGTGTDSLNVYDQSNTFGQTFSLGASSLSRLGSAAITYSGINFVTINGGNGNNTYNVSGTEDAFATTLNTGNGHDTVNVSGTGFFGTFTINEGTGGDDVNLGATIHNLDSLHSTIHVNGNQMGVDNLTVNDQASSASQTFTLNIYSITRTGAGMIQYNNLLDSVTVATGTGGATVDVLGTSTPTSIVGHSTVTVNIGNAGSVQQIVGLVTITNPPSLTTVNVDDSADGAGHAVTLDTVTIGGADYGRIMGLAPAVIQYKDLDTSTVTVQTGTGGGGTVNVLATNVPVNLIGHGTNTVNVGNAGSVQAINGPLTISNSSSLATVNVDDSADGTARTVSLDTVAIGGSNYGRITGLGSAPIQYKYAGTNTVTVQTGTGGDMVNVLATGAPLNLIGHASNTVNVGNAGSVQAIYGPLTISGSPSSLATVNVDDSADGTARSVALDTVTIGGSDYGRVTGLGSAAIQYKYSDTLAVTVQTGTGSGSGVNVLATNVPVNLIGHSPAGFNVGNAGSVQAINGPLTITGSPGSVVNVDDSADSAARTAVTLDTVTISGSDYGRITGLGSAAIQYKYSDTVSVWVQTGTGGDNVNVLATGSPVNLIGHGVNTINVGNAGNVQAINAPLTITDPGSSTMVNAADYADLSARTVYLDTVTIGSSHYGRITGLAPALIQYKYSDTSFVLAQTGFGGGTVNVLATGMPVSLVGTGSETVNVGNAGSVQAINGPLTINGFTLLGTVNVDDSADGTYRTVTLDTVTNGGYDYGRITGLAPAAIEYYYAGTNTVTVQKGTGGAMVNVLASGAPVNLIVNSPNATVNVGNAGSVQAIADPLTITDPSYFATVNVDDSADLSARTVTLDTVTIGGASFGSITGLGSAAIRYKYADTEPVTVQTGFGGATVNVLATGTLTSIVGHATGIVNIGNAGSVQQIVGPVTITDPPVGTAVMVNVDDSADGTYRTVTLDTVTLGGSDYGRITGLAPAAIQYKYSDSNSVTVQTGTGGATVDALTTGKPVNLMGNPSSPISLVASDGSNTWNITSQNAGTLSSMLLVGTVTFSGATNLAGGNGADTFAFADGAGVDGTIDGGGGTNTLDYSAYSSTVLVDLQTGSATGVGTGIANIQNVTGGSGGGAGVYNILVGNGGNVLTGGDGRRNLLIAGASASTLIGGNDDDILIGGTTAYDTEAGMVSLQAIMNYWSSTADDYGTRVANLLSGNGVPLLDATMVTNNGGGNILMGNHGGAGEMNFFYGLDPTLETTDYNPATGEQFINC
jgi:hypothetical protein